MKVAVTVDAPAVLILVMEEADGLVVFAAADEKGLCITLDKFSSKAMGVNHVNAF